MVNSTFLKKPMDLVRIEQYEASGQTIEWSVNRSPMKEAIQRVLLLRQVASQQRAAVIEHLSTVINVHRSSFAFRKSYIYVSLMELRRLYSCMIFFFWGGGLLVVPSLKVIE